MRPKKTPMSVLHDRVFARDADCCRMPWCRRFSPPGYDNELAHLEAKGMGGNPDDSRNTTANTICCCKDCHRGPRSLHSGHLKWRFLTDQGADGPMAFTWCEKLPTAELGVPRYKPDMESA